LGGDLGPRGYAGKMTDKKYAIAASDEVAIKAFIISATITMALSAVRFFISAFTPILQFPGYTGLWEIGKPLVWATLN